MVEEDIEDAKKLSPEERIRRLREIAKRDEDEIRKAHDMIKASEGELEEEEKAKKQIPIPQLKSVDVGTLFGKGTQEDLMFKTKQFREAPGEEPEEGTVVEEEPLEEAVAREPIREAAREEAARQQYMQQLVRAPAEQLAERMRNIYEGAMDKGYVSKSEIQEVYTISYALEEKQADIRSGSYTADQKAKEEILGSSSILKALKDRYRGK
jgi:hypothetical protein